MAETLELVTRGIDQRRAGERDIAGRLEAQYDDFTDPKKRDQRIAEYKKIAPLQKDPAYVDRMTKMEAGKEENAATLLRESPGPRQSRGRASRSLPAPGDGRGAFSGRQGGGRL